MERWNRKKKTKHCISYEWQHQMVVLVCRSFQSCFWYGPDNQPSCGKGEIISIPSSSYVQVDKHSKAIVNFASESLANQQHGLPVPGIGKGIGLVFVLFFLQVISSLFNQQHLYRSMSTGILLRGGLITAIYRRCTKLTARARSTLPNGKLVNHISTDVSRIDYCCFLFHTVCSF